MKQHQPRRKRCEECGERMDLRPWFGGGSYWICRRCDALDLSGMKMRTVRIKYRGRLKTVHWNKTKGQEGS